MMQFREKSRAVPSSLHFGASLRGRQGVPLCVLFVSSLIAGFGALCFLAHFATAGESKVVNAPESVILLAEQGENVNPLLSTNQLRNPCPPGHRVEFVFGKTSLFVDMEWLDRWTIGEVNKIANGICPRDPIHGVDLFFHGSRPPEVLRKFAERGLPSYILISGTTTKRNLSDGPSAPQARIEIPGGGYIEDVTKQVFGEKSSVSSPRRFYRLQHPENADGSQSRSFLMGCGGAPNEAPLGRHCTTSYLYSEDIYLRYEFRLDRYDISGFRWPTPDGSISEPEGLLSFDTNIRNWLNGLRH